MTLPLLIFQICVWDTQDWRLGPQVKNHCSKVMWLYYCTVLTSSASARNTVPPELASREFVGTSRGQVPNLFATWNGMIPLLVGPRTKRNHISDQGWGLGLETVSRRTNVSSRSCLHKKMTTSRSRLGLGYLRLVPKTLFSTKLCKPH